VDRRNEDLSRILRELHLPSSSRERRNYLIAQGGNVPILDNFDCVFLIGDLNFRINTMLEYTRDFEIKGENMLEVTPLEERN